MAQVQQWWRERHDGLDPKLARGREHRDRAHNETGDQVAREDHAPPRHAVDDRAGQEHHDQHRGAEDRAPQSELQRATAEREDLEGQRDTVDEVADHRDGLSSPEKPEIAVTQRLERARESHR